MKNSVRILAALAAALILAGCAAPKEEPEAGLPNPVVEVADATGFAPLGLAITAPEKAENVRYSVISDAVAQIQYELDGLSFTYRAAKSKDDIAGVYEAFDEQELGLCADGEDWSATITVKTVNGGKSGAVANWFAGDIQYSLYTSGAVTAEQMGEYATSLAEKDYPRAVE